MQSISKQACNTIFHRELIILSEKNSDVKLVDCLRFVSLTAEPFDSTALHHPCWNGAMEPFGYKALYHPSSNGAVEPVNYIM